MQSDDLDNRIRGLVEGNDDPAFDEKSWDKMELLLDKHLPQEKKRRRIYFFLLFVLLLSIPGYLVIQNRLHHGKIGGKEQTPSSPIIVKKELQVDDVQNEPVQQDLTHTPLPGNGKKEPGVTNDVVISKENGPEESPQSVKEKVAVPIPVDQSKNDPTRNKKTFTRTQKTGFIKERVIKQTEIVRNNNKKEPGKEQANISTTDQSLTTDKKPVDNISLANSSTITKDTITQSPVGNTASTSKVEAAIPETKDTAAAVEEKTTAQQKKSGKASKFFLSFSAGPDVSSIGINNPGKADLQYGLGLGYAITARFSVRAGFYTNRKRYVASPSEYHPPAGYWTYNANLQKVDADCKVYEIPLNVLYTLGSKKNHSWFVSGGASSYIMKRETYGYDYKTQSGQPAYYSRTIDNKNKHIFSVLNLSGGYTYTFNKRLSFMAEPYVKVPLTGVGFGKVNLNSGGILFTLSVKPFGK